jgi:hypothetical protein
MFVLKEYGCQEKDLKSTLNQIYKDYAEIIGRYIPAKGIPTYVYGGSDKGYLLKSLEGKSNKSARREMEKTLNFKNVQDYIWNYMAENNITTVSNKQKDIATALNVVKHEPVHNALSDCKTLFNILAKILLVAS